MANYQELAPVDRAGHEKCTKPPNTDIGGTPPIGWPVDGQLHQIGNPVTPPQKLQWQTGLLSCCGKGDEFYSADLEVCILGSVAPCVLYGSNAERMNVGSGSNSFASHCLPYTALYLLGACFFGWNCFAPCLSFHTRTAIRRRFNLQGSSEAARRLCSCCGGDSMNEAQLEQCEMAGDFANHMLCHACALCQEAREVRRRLPHPAYIAHAPAPVMLMVPPGQQTMSLP